MKISELIDKDFKTKRIELLRLRFQQTEFMLFQMLFIGIFKQESLKERIDIDLINKINDVSDKIFDFKIKLNNAINDCLEQDKKSTKEDNDRLNELIKDIPDFDKISESYEWLLSQLDIGALLSKMPEGKDKENMLHRKALHKCYRLLNQSILSDEAQKDTWQQELHKLVSSFEEEFNKKYKEDPTILMSTITKTTSAEFDLQNKFAELAISRTRNRPQDSSRDNELVAAKFEKDGGMTKDDLLNNIKLLKETLESKNKKGTLRLFSLNQDAEELAALKFALDGTSGIVPCLIKPAASIRLMEQFLVGYIKNNYPENMIVKSASGYKL